MNQARSEEKEKERKKDRGQEADGKKGSPIKQKHIGGTTMHFIGRVTMFFANNSLMECLITMKFLDIFFTP